MSELGFDQKEELDSLQAIYCKPDELKCWESSEGQHVIIQFDVSSSNAENVVKGGVQVLLPTEYPATCPMEIDIFCSVLSDSTLNSLRLQVEERAGTLKGECMLLDLMCYAQELLESSLDHDNILTCDKKLQHSNIQQNDSASADLITSGIDANDSDVAISSFSIDGHNHNDANVSSSTHNGNRCQDIALLQLDHMRAKQNYVKLVERWTAELGLQGRLLFYGRFIFIILQGSSQDIKEYIVRNKTMIVDVDAKGRPCKERMLRVLCEATSDKLVRFHEFKTMENISSLEEFTSLFQSFSMMDIFNAYVEPQCSTKSKKSLKR